MVNDSKNRKATKAIAAIEKRFGVDGRTAVITKDEFEAVGDYIFYLEDLLVEANRKASRTETADLTNDETQDVCPGCGGVADNGYDRSWPEPNPYYCTKCESGVEETESENSSRKPVWAGQKPSWEDAPKWANWLAQNKSGGFYWFKDKPFRTLIEWNSSSPYYEYAGWGNENPAWEYAIEQRLNQQ